MWQNSYGIQATLWTYQGGTVHGFGQSIAWFLAILARLATVMHECGQCALPQLEVQPYSVENCLLVKEAALELTSLL